MKRLNLLLPSPLTPVPAFHQVTYTSCLFLLYYHSILTLPVIPSAVVLYLFSVFYHSVFTSLVTLGAIVSYLFTTVIILSSCSLPLPFYL